MEHSELRRESETLFIPLLCKAEASRWGDFPTDKKAAEIVAGVDYDFSALRQSKYLSIYMGIRSAIFDGYAEEFLAAHPQGTVLHLGCGLDSRALRLSRRAGLWVDVDLPPVIALRRRFYGEDERHQMRAVSVTEPAFLEQLPQGEEPVLVLAEGLSMYLTEEENQAIFTMLGQRFSSCRYVFDAYSLSAVAWSKYKNPVNKMGAVIRWGLDEPQRMEGSGLCHTATRYFTEQRWVDCLSGSVRRWFRLLYGSRWANSLYRVYVYDKGEAL